MQVHWPLFFAALFFVSRAPAAELSWHRLYPDSATAWVEGVDGYGEGESVTLKFSPLNLKENQVNCD